MNQPKDYFDELENAVFHRLEQCRQRVRRAFLLGVLGGLLLTVGAFGLGLLISTWIFV